MIAVSILLSSAETKYKGIHPSLWMVKNLFMLLYKLKYFFFSKPLYCLGGRNTNSKTLRKFMWLYVGVQKYHVYIDLCKSQFLLDAENLFEHELGALNMAALRRKEERAGLLSNLGPCCKALCFRRDSAIRKQLVKNEKASAGSKCGSTDASKQRFSLGRYFLSILFWSRPGPLNNKLTFI